MFARRPQRLPARDNRDNWRINTSFPCPSLLNSSIIVYQCHPTQANCWHRPGYYQAEEPDYLPSRAVFVGKMQRLVFNLRKRDRMPTSVNIRRSSTSFVTVFTSYTAAAFALGVSVFLQLPRVCPAQKSWQVAGHDENIPLWFLCFHLGE